MVSEGSILLLVFLIELFILFLFSKKISTFVFNLFYKLSKNYDFSIMLLAVIFFPGTLIHELAHFLMAVASFVHVGNVEFMPQRFGDSIKLGSVEIGQTDPFRRALIGLAPLIGGISIITFSLLFFPKIDIWWGKVLLIYLIFEISNTMFSSKKDIEGLLGLLIGIIVTGVAGYFLLQYLNFSISVYSIIEFLFNQKLIDFLSRSIFLLTIPLILDLAIFSLFKLFKLSGR